MNTKTFLFFSVILFLFFSCQNEEKQTISYFFERPATIWEETLPLGNGRIGMMPDGGIMQETYVLNEISLWSGRKQDTDNPEAQKSLSKIQELLFAGKNDEAQKLTYETFVCKGQGSAYGQGRNAPYGSYQMLGTLFIKYNYDNQDTIQSYKRTLNLSDAVAVTEFRKANTKFTRESFTSFSNDIGIIRLKAEGDEKLNFMVGQTRPERYTFTSENNDLLMNGYMNNGDGGNGNEYSSRIRIILPSEGESILTDSAITIKNADEAIIYISMATSYFGDNPQEKNLNLLDEASSKSYKVLLNEHTNKYHSLFDRVKLDLGTNENNNLPINKRLEAYQQGTDDPALLSLYFQFGRYLLISSTREGLLPPNLQGLWANTLDTPWNGDYHLNINLQMNLWPAEVTNLSELHKPLIEWTHQQVKSGEQTAQAFYKARGWVTHILGNVWEFTAPGEHPSWGATNTSAAWLCQHLYNHYLYNQDIDYLREAYPTIKSAALFFTDMLIRDPRNGWLVTAPTTSPENSFIMPNGSRAAIVAGSTMDNQIIRELFTNVIEASSILNTDKDFADLLIQKLDSLKPTTIGKDGRIMEWMEEYEEAEPTHRHVSHLYALYPGNQISISETPELAEAARASLEARGDESTGWSMAWKINFWARLHDGNRALKLLKDMLSPVVDENSQRLSKGGTYPNLFCAHPPFQIDGNFGSCAGIAEMLVQSHTGTVEFLPALPDSWNRGSVEGLKVIGGGVVAINWQEGTLKKASLTAKTDYNFTIKLDAPSRDYKIEGKEYKVEDNLLKVSLKKGEQITIKKA